MLKVLYSDRARQGTSKAKKIVSAASVKGHVYLVSIAFSSLGVIYVLHIIDLNLLELSACILNAMHLSNVTYVTLLHSECKYPVSTWLGQLTCKYKLTHLSRMKFPTYINCIGSFSV